MMAPELEQPKRGDAEDKTNPIVGGAPTVWAGTLWGLAAGLSEGSKMEHKATAACSTAPPDVTACSLVLPREKLQLAKQSQTGAGRAAPVSVPPQQMLAARLLLAGMRVGEAAQYVGVCRH